MNSSEQLLLLSERDNKSLCKMTIPTIQEFDLLVGQNKKENRIRLDTIAKHTICLVQI